ncbi:MAG: hypothetical protein KTR24_18020 [Saprospiraceae bacterium]|nr:hypothetical protein [Saprospiraceae bacterium]
MKPTFCPPVVRSCFVLIVACCCTALLAQSGPHIFADDTCIILNEFDNAQMLTIEGTLDEYIISIRDEGDSSLVDWAHPETDLNIDLEALPENSAYVQLQHQTHAALFVCAPLPETFPEIRWNEAIGSSRLIPFFPDTNANYFVYYYALSDAPDCALKISGDFANARYLSYTVYNTSTRNDIADISDFELIPLAQHENPYSEGSYTEGQQYELVIGPDHLDLSAYPNKVQFTSDVPGVAVFLRYYYPRSDHYGSVELPEMQFVTDLGTNKAPPPPLTSEILIDPQEVIDLTNDIARLFFSIERSRERMFFRATSNATGNFATPDNQYLISPVTLGQDEVVVLRWKAPSVDEDFSNLGSAQTRYFSMSLSNDNTFTASTLGSDQIVVGSDGFITLVVSRSDPEIEAAAASVNFMAWDEFLGNRGYLIYRNLLTRPGFSGDIANCPTVTDIPFLVAIAPGLYDAAGHIGAYAPQGDKMSKAEFLSTF